MALDLTKLDPDLANKLLDEIHSLGRRVVVKKWDEDLEQTGFQDVSLAVRGEGDTLPQERFDAFLKFLHTRAQQPETEEVIKKNTLIEEAFDSLNQLIEARISGDVEIMRVAHRNVRECGKAIKDATDRRVFGTNEQLQLFQAAQLVAESGVFLSSGQAMSKVAENRGREA